MTFIFDETTLLVNPKENLIISSERKKPRKKLPPFEMLGVQKMFKLNGEQILKGFPTQNTILQFNAAEKWFYIKLKENINPTLKIHLPNKQFSQAEQNKKSFATKSLISKKLIKKIKREWYMLNPEAFIFVNEHKNNMIEWNKL